MLRLLLLGILFERDFELFNLIKGVLNFGLIFLIKQLSHASELLCELRLLHCHLGLSLYIGLLCGIAPVVGHNSLGCLLTVGHHWRLHHLFRLLMLLLYFLVFFLFLIRFLVFLVVLLAAFLLVTSRV